MGETYIIANPSKRQYIDIGGFNENNKASGLMQHRHACAVAALVCNLDRVIFASGKPKHDFSDLAGSWCGDKLYVLGDMNGQLDDPLLEMIEGQEESMPLFDVAKNQFDDITIRVIAMLATGIPGFADEMVREAKEGELSSNFVRLGDVAVQENCAPMADALVREFGDDWQRRYKEL